ncbi:MAG: DUF427 domain-containing protein, partial [Flavobacteriaceae bacterium]
GQESVWDYPRPPRLEPFNDHIHIILDGEVILKTEEAFRILETSHPPTYYLPMDHFNPGVLRRTYGVSFCEYKGKASHYDIYGKEQVVLRAAWRYPDASGIYLAIKDHIAVYANLMDACFVNNEKVIAQEGEFYGGWITSNIVGPFKGGAGTYDW